MRKLGLSVLLAVGLTFAAALGALADGIPSGW
jgi:hypothetical protein